MYPPLQQRINRLDNMIPTAPAKILNYQGRVAEQIRSTQFNPPRWKQLDPISAILGFYHGGKEVLWSTGEGFHARNILYGDLASPYHTNEGVVFNYVLSGEIRKMIMGQTLTLYAGDGCIMDTNSIQCELIDPHDAIVFCINIHPDFFLPELIDNTNPMEQFLINATRPKQDHSCYLHLYHTTAPESLEKIFEQLLEEQQQMDISSIIIQRGLIRRLFRLCEQYCETELIHSSTNYKHDILFFEIDRYLRAHLATACAAELENVFHFNRNYYSKVIKAKTGLTFSAYLRQLRLQTAKQWLTESNQSIQKISALLGYENRNFFYQLFRAETGLTPQEYRRQTRTP